MKIKEALDMKGASDAKIAKQMGIERQSLRAYKEKGCFPASRIVKFCLTYKLPVEAFMSSSENKIAQKGEEITKDATQHSDTSAIDQLMGGTGMYTIGDMVLWVMKNGTDQDREDLMMWKKRFIDCTSARIDEIKARYSVKKNKAG